MHGFDIEQLKTFVEVVDAGSVTAAAPLRCRSQSALSEQLNRLEAAAGKQLLIRGKKGMQPTPAGHQLITHARKILALSDAAWRDMHHMSVLGEIRIGFSDYFQTGDLAPLLAGISHKYPGLRMRTQIDKSSIIAAAHSAGALDIAIILQIAGSRPSPSPDAVVLRREPVMWVTARDRPVVLKDNVLELVLLYEGCSFHRLALRELAAHRIPHTVAHVASGVPGIQAAVYAGLGVACLNESAVVKSQMAEVSGLPPLPTADIILLPPVRPDGKADERLESVSKVIMSALHLS